jgi:hypothetical protein
MLSTTFCLEFPINAQVALIDFYMDHLWQFLYGSHLSSPFDISTLSFI